MKKTINKTIPLIIMVFALLIVLKPQTCLNYALRGILICGNVIIPSIFPFTFCVLFINNSGVLNYMRSIDKLSKTVLGLSYYELAIFLISLVGGYPIGAKMLKNEKIKKADIMINYCVNAGPAFVVLAIGKGVFKNVVIGWVLFASHILSSVLLMLILSNKAKKITPQTTRKTPTGAVENFVISSADAADTVIKICGLVILFSVINGYIQLLSTLLPPIKFLGLLCEVTNAVINTKNILTVSFLLGFGGFSIWAQVFAFLKETKINYFNFIAFRMLHGIFSAAITYLLIKIFKPKVYTLSNGIKFSAESFINRPAVAISLIIMGIVLIISLYTKNYAGNLREDIV